MGIDIIFTGKTELKSGRELLKGIIEEDNELDAELFINVRVGSMYGLHPILEYLNYSIMDDGERYISDNDIENIIDFHITEIKEMEIDDDCKTTDDMLLIANYNEIIELMQKFKRMKENYRVLRDMELYMYAY